MKDIKNIKFDVVAIKNSIEALKMIIDYGQGKIEWPKEIRKDRGICDNIELVCIRDDRHDGNTVVLNKFLFQTWDLYTENHGRVYPVNGRQEFDDCINQDNFYDLPGCGKRFMLAEHLLKQLNLILEWDH